MKTYSYRQHGYLFFILLISYVASLPMVAIAHGWKAPSEAAQKINPLQMNEASIQEGRKSYAYACASCHGKNAGGDGPLAKDLDPKPADLQGNQKDKIAQHVVVGTSSANHSFSEKSCRSGCFFF